MSTRVERAHGLEDVGMLVSGQVHWSLIGRLDRAECRLYPVFNIEVRQAVRACPRPSSIHGRTWPGPAAYDDQARRRACL